MALGFHRRLRGLVGNQHGQLLALAAESFATFVTVDKSLPYPQNTTVLPLADIVLESTSKELSVMIALVPALEKALGSLQRGHTC